MGKNSTIRSVIALLIITAVAGVFLGFVYEITKEPIERKKEEDKQRAYKVVFESADVFEEVVDIDNSLWENIKKENKFDKVNINSVVKAMSSSGDILGYILIVTSKEGYGGNIDITVGITADKVVNGIEITSISETAGLGAKAAEKAFKLQYSNKKVEYFENVKTGKNADNQIDVISGATITTNAVTNAVNGAIKYCNEILLK